MNRNEIKIGQQWKRNDEPTTIATIQRVMTHSVQYQVSTERRGCNKVFFRKHFTLLD